MNQNTDNRHEEGVISSQKIQATTRLLENNSYQQSLYIAAISKYIGVEGLHSPASDVKYRTEYTFDFYHSDSGCFFKVVKGFDRFIYSAYFCHPDDPYIILDLDDTDARFEECECCGRIFLSVPAEIAKQIYSDESTFVYFDGELWEYHGHNDDTWEWKICVPAVLREVLENDED